MTFWRRGQDIKWVLPGQDFVGFTRTRERLVLAAQSLL